MSVRLRQKLPRELVSSSSNALLDLQRFLSKPSSLVDPSLLAGCIGRLARGGERERKVLGAPKVVGLLFKKIPEMPPFEIVSVACDLNSAPPSPPVRSLLQKVSEEVSRNIHILPLSDLASLSRALQGDSALLGSDISKKLLLEVPFRLPRMKDNEFRFKERSADVRVLKSIRGMVKPSYKKQMDGDKGSVRKRKVNVPLSHLSDFLKIAYEKGMVKEHEKTLADILRVIEKFYLDKQSKELSVPGNMNSLWNDGVAIRKSIDVTSTSELSALSVRMLLGVLRHPLFHWGGHETLPIDDLPLALEGALQLRRDPILGGRAVGSVKKLALEVAENAEKMKPEQLSFVLLSLGHAIEGRRASGPALCI